MQLSEHFSFEELTATSNAALQDLNRLQAQAFLKPLTAVAETLERVRAFLGAPISVHSGYRGPELNGATPGSSKTSQHMKGEAADFSCPAKFQETDEGNTALFAALKDFLATRSITFGQLIDEGCVRPYSRVVWIHLSLGAPWRDPARCGQLLRMRDGAFTSLGTVPQP